MISIRQAPIRTGFGPETTASDVIRGHDLTGKVVIVTGGYSGIGLETARAFHSAGAKVIVPARNLAKAASALRSMRGAVVEALDLMDPASIVTDLARYMSAEELRARTATSPAPYPRTRPSCWGSGRGRPIQK